MAGTFNAAAVAGVMSAVKSVPQRLGSLRSSVIMHEPLAPPSSLPALALWAGPIEPVGAISGQSEVSGRLTVSGRIFVVNAQMATDKTEELLLSLASEVLGAFAGAFTLGGADDVMCVDLLGMYGQKLSAEPGYVTYASVQYRAVEIGIPIVIDPLWTEAP